jgi:signal transduction histidine kinase
MQLRLPDVALVVIVAALVVAGSSKIEHSGTRHIDAVAIVLGVAGALSLGVSRRFPAVMAAVTTTVVFVYLARGYPGGPSLLVGPVSMALLGFRASRTVALLGATAMSLAVIAGKWIGDGQLGTIGIAGPAWAYTLVLVGVLLDARRDRIAAQGEREELKRAQAITDERLLIAQDLHDSVAHALATINVQSGVAAHLLDRDPQQAKAALEAIRHASSEVLDELGTMLGALRQPDQAAPRLPTAGLEQVDGLVARARADGLRVECQTAGDNTVVPSAIGAAAYRVIQEALNNVRRHAGPSPVVTITTVADSAEKFSLSVVDDGGTGQTGRPSGDPSPGLGLVGMRERVESSGGTLTAGSDPTTHGYRVTATWDRR